MADLKPCPFCGGDAVLWRAGSGRAAWIACMGECSVLVSREYENDDAAIAAWNRRAPDPRDEVIRGLCEALEGIEIYGRDTLSGRTDGPDDRKWHREGVFEMVNRAATALAAARKLGVG